MKQMKLTMAIDDVDQAPEVEDQAHSVGVDHDGELAEEADTTHHRLGWCHLLRL